jgi:hypothetical protein
MSDDEEKVLRFPRTERHHLNDVLDNLRQLSGRSLGYYKLVGRIRECIALGQENCGTNRHPSSYRD